MFRNLKKSIFLFLFIIFISSSAFAREGRSKFLLGFRVPIIIPTFTSLQEENATTGEYESKVYTFSGMGFKSFLSGFEVEFGSFITPDISLGGSLGYVFGYDRGNKLFSKVPFLFRSNYFVYSSDYIDVPITLILGVNYFNYRSMEHMVMQIGFEAGVNAYWTENWAGSFKTGFYLYPELYSDSHKNNLSGFIPIIIGLTFRR